MSIQQDETALYDEATDALAQGDLHRAADLCKSLLVTFPQSARGYHLTSSLFQATGNYRKAYDYSAIATSLDDCVAQYHLQQGKVSFLLKDYDQALVAFERAVNITANENEEACCWLGKTLAALERFAEAKKWLRHSESVEARIAEAECDMQAGDVGAAEKILVECIEKNPRNAQAHFILALLAMSEAEFGRVEELLRKVLVFDARYPQAHFYLALLLAESGDTKGAADRLLQALQIDPTHLASLLVLGGIFMQSGDVAASEKAFSHVLALAPDHLLAWYSLLDLLEKKGTLREGIAQLNALLGTLPNPAVLRHLRALFNGDVPPAAPREYVAAFYGAFLDMFEPWVVAGSDGPHVEALAKSLRELPQLQGKKYISLLDLGCSSGVLAKKLSDIAAIVVGVDASQQMVKIARRNKHYDVLYDLEAVEYVAGSETVFDVVASTGALRWVGNLQPFFFAVRGVMHKDSVLAFMLDKEQSTLAYSVANHGRYSHHYSYVCDVATAEGFELLLHKEWSLETSQNDKMVRHMFFFKKMTVH